uniref:PUR family DNA/RNA-binding protein n=1 Tax=Ornithobacterium rhinotracheale TaxID=28251 RepID=UPI0039A49AD8
MAENSFYGNDENDEIFSKTLRAGRRTYFFDVRETKAGDYYLTITESKKSVNPDGSFYFKKHKIYLYKEDFENFQENLKECADFVIEQKGEEVISERHQHAYDENAEISPINSEREHSSADIEKFTELRFEDI